MWPAFISSAKFPYLGTSYTQPHRLLWIESFLLLGEFGLRGWYITACKTSNCWIHNIHCMYHLALTLYRLRQIGIIHFRNIVTHFASKWVIFHFIWVIIQWDFRHILCSYLLWSGTLTPWALYNLTQSKWKFLPISEPGIVTKCR